MYAMLQPSLGNLRLDPLPRSAIAHNDKVDVRVLLEQFGSLEYRL